MEHQSYTSRYSIQTPILYQAKFSNIYLIYITIYHCTVYKNEKLPVLSGSLASKQYQFMNIYSKQTN